MMMDLTFITLPKVKLINLLKIKFIKKKFYKILKWKNILEFKNFFLIKNKTNINLYLEELVLFIK